MGFVRQTWIRLCLSLLFGAVLTVSAQPTLSFETFEHGGQTHLIRYSDATVGLTAPARTALQESIDKLLPMFDVGAAHLPFQIVLDLLQDSPDTEGDAIIEGLDAIGEPLADIFAGDSACHIRIFTNTVPHAYMSYVIAHELGHCLGFHYFSDATAGLPNDLNGWWFEGTSEWLASHVYPHMAAAVSRSTVTQDELVDLEDVSESITDSARDPEYYGGYGSFYFWHFLETQRSMDVIDMMRAMPTGTVTEETYQDYLVGQLGDAGAVMHEFGLALAQETLTYHPSSALLYGVPSITSSLPHEITIGMENDFSFYLGATLVQPTGASAVQIITEGLTDLSGPVRMSVNTSGSTFTQVDDFSPVLLCMTDEGVLARIVITRGDVDASTAFKIHFEAASDATGCEEPPMLEASATCAVGTWQLTNNPARRIAADQLGSQYGTGGSPGTTMLMIDDDYQVSYSIENYVLVLADASQQSGGSMTMNALMTAELSAIPDFDGTLYVSNFDWNIEALSAVANINGFEMDMTDVVLGAAETADTLGPTPARMECVGDQFLDWWMIIGDRTYTWHFSRVGP